MSDEPTTNSGAWWAKLKDEDLQRELGRSSPGQDSYVGARDEIQRRAAVKRERLMRWALGLAALSLLASFAIALEVISVRQQLTRLGTSGSPALAEGPEQPGQAPAGETASSDRSAAPTGAGPRTRNGSQLSNAPDDGMRGASGDGARNASGEGPQGTLSGAATGAPNGGAAGGRSQGSEGARGAPEGAAPQQRGGGKAGPDRGQDVTPMERGDRAHGSAPRSRREPRIAACQRSCPRSAKAGATMVGQVAASA